MAVEVQDNAREKELRDLFGLSKDVSAGRSGVDAYKIFKGKRIEFELKSTTTGSVTTVRDFGPDHIEKWKNKHWIIGCYSSSQDLKYTIYGPPDMMEDWINEKEQYIALDFELAETIPQHTSIEDMNSLISEKKIYTLDDAKMVQRSSTKLPRVQKTYGFQKWIFT